MEVYHVAVCLLNFVKHDTLSHKLSRLLPVLFIFTAVDSRFKSAC